MSRDLTAAMLTELQASAIRPRVFLEVEWASGFTRLWTGVGDKSWDGHTWTGTGTLLSVGPAGETTRVRALGMTVSLSGIDSAYIALALGQARQGKPVKAWLGFLDSSDAIIADPVLMFAGYVDVPEFAEDGETATITLTAEHRLIDLRRARTWRFTSAEQKALYPSDKGFDHVPAVQTWTGAWGNSFPVSPGQADIALEPGGPFDDHYDNPA